MQKQSLPGKKEKAAPVARCGFWNVWGTVGSVRVLFRCPGQILTAGADVLAQTLHGSAGRETGGGDGKK